MHCEICNTPIAKDQRIYELSCSNQKQCRVLEEVAEFFKILGAEGAVDDAMVAAHADAHAMADNNLIAIIHNGSFSDCTD